MSDLQISEANSEIPIKRPGFFKRLSWPLFLSGRLMDELAEKPRVLLWLLFMPVVFVLLSIIHWQLYLD